MWVQIHSVACMACDLTNPVHSKGLREDRTRTRVRRLPGTQGPVQGGSLCPVPLV